jgi:hypothetical protein
LHELSKLSTLYRLRLEKTNITDSGIKHLEKMEYDALSLCDTSLTDACLPALARITRITRLDVTNTKLTQEALLGLPNYSQIHDIWVSDEQGKRINIALTPEERWYEERR